jgi:hypothetical protein
MLKIPLEKNKINFIIDCRHSFDESLSGGIIVLHKLALELIELGHNVYMPTKPMYSDKIIEIPTHGRTLNNYTNLSFGYDVFEYPIENTISIYPEITQGNPFNTKYVVRWVLQHTEKSVEITWDDTDFVYNFSNFNTNKKYEKKQLTTFDFRFEQMYDKKYESRNGFCFINHKNTPENHSEIINLFKPTDLSGWEQKGNWSFLSEEFNKHEYFITFDRQTTFCILASMCGCKSIILNEDTSLSPLEYRQLNPFFQYGISYGLSDISWSSKTTHLCRDYIKELDKHHKKTVFNFVNDLKNIIYEK